MEVGLIEVMFVGVVIALLFGTLNYFNILRLSELFPNQLDFLPRRNVPTGTSQQSQQYSNVTISPTTANPSNLTQQAKKTLLDTLPNILTPILMPESSQITIKQDKNPLGKTFISSWNTKEATESSVVAIFITTDSNISQLYLSLERPQNTPPSVDLASTITPQLFSVQPKGKWGCKPLSNSMAYCENFWEENDGIRRGLGIKGLFTQGANLIRGQSEVMLVFCEHTKESKLYSWKSCEFEFK